MTQLADLALADAGGCAGALPPTPTAWDRYGDGRGIRVLASESAQWMVRERAATDLGAIAGALAHDATARRILAKRCTPADGQMVGVRLNLNILRLRGVAVHSLHRGGSAQVPMRGGGFYAGEVLDYRAIVTLRNAWFSVNQRGREAIAGGRVPKFPMASVDGELCPEDPCTDGVEARFNPKYTHLFVDSAGYALRWAECVTIVGHRAYARGLLVYHDEASAPARPSGCQPSMAKLLAR